MGETRECEIETENCLRSLDGCRDDRYHLVVLIALNVGFSEMFALLWLRSWGIAYVVVVPAILLIGPALQAQIDRLIQ
jgi:hypothetical protein